MSLLGSAFAATGVTVVLASGADAASPGQSCKPKGAVLQTQEQTLLCAQTPDDKKYRWRVITVQGPPGAVGPTGPQGPPGTGGGAAGQTAHYVEAPWTPNDYTRRFQGWRVEEFDGSDLFWTPIYENSNLSLLRYEVPQGVRVLAVSLVAEYNSQQPGDTPRISETPFQALGAESFTWDGAPVGATSFQARVDIIQSASCADVPQRRLVCAAPILTGEASRGPIRTS